MNGMKLFIFLMFHPKSHTPIFEEYRVFYIGNKPLVVIDYWNNRKINLSTEDKKVIMDAPKEVKAKFYTIDFARKSNGKLVIMEMGDGQVSGNSFKKWDYFLRLSLKGTLDRLNQKGYLVVLKKISKYWLPCSSPSICRNSNDLIVK